jgi:Flp pilus assembly protein TadG
MVEFAMVAPVLFLVVFGIIAFGHTYGRYLDLKSATADGARRGSVSMDAADPVQKVRVAFMDSLTLTKDTNVSISVTPAPPWNHGDKITVRTSTPHRINVMGITVWSGNLQAESEIRIE